MTPLRFIDSLVVNAVNDYKLIIDNQKPTRKELACRSAEELAYAMSTSIVGHLK